MHKITRIQKVTKKDDKKEYQDRKQYSRLTRSGYRGGLSKKTISEYKRIHGEKK